MSTQSGHKFNGSAVTETNLHDAERAVSPHTVCIGAPSLRRWNRPEPSRKTLIVTGSAAGASGLAVATRQHADAAAAVAILVDGAP